MLTIATRPSFYLLVGMLTLLGITWKLQTTDLERYKRRGLEEFSTEMKLALSMPILAYKAPAIDKGKAMGR